MPVSPYLKGPIVVVDDQAESGTVLRRALSHLAPNADVIAAQHGAGVLIQIESRQVSLVLTDYHMPDMNGEAVVRAVKARSPGTFVAVLTGDVDVQLERQLRAAGADQVLYKPFMLADLVALLQAVAQRNRATTRVDAA